MGITVNMNSLPRLILLATMTFSSVQSASAQNQTAEHPADNSSPSFAKTFEPMTQRVNIDCGDRQFIFNNDPKNQKFEFSVVTKQGETTYPLIDSALTSIILDKSRFDSINYRCAERGISLLYEGYQYSKKDGLSPISQMIFVSNKGEVTIKEISKQHDDLPELARRSGIAVIENSQTKTKQMHLSVHGPWSPTKIEMSQTIQCKDRQFTLSYLPYYRNLNFTANIKGEVQRRDISSSALQKILENRAFYFRSTYACIEDGFALQFQGLAEIDDNHIEPLTLTLHQALHGNTVSFNQIDELLVADNETPLRGEIQLMQSSWKTTRQQVKETRVLPSKPVSKPNTATK
jgi:hypothetical protein